MTDLNLDGLPALQSIVEAGKAAPSSRERKAIGELRRLVERERKAAWDEACDAGAAIYRAEYEHRLPAWAKPVIGAVRELACSEPLSDEEDECCDKVRELGETLTEAQLKEIGEDDG